MNRPAGKKKGIIDESKAQGANTTKKGTTEPHTMPEVVRMDKDLDCITNTHIIFAFFSPLFHYLRLRSLQQAPLTPPSLFNLKHQARQSLEV